jgi:23S rRNA (guanine1835-N2)-methyltransferase
MRRKPELEAGRDDWTIHNHANVFPAPGWISARVSSCTSAGKSGRRDRRSRLRQRVIGLTLLAKNPNARVVFTDESPWRWPPAG